MLEEEYYHDKANCYYKNEKFFASLSIRVVTADVPRGVSRGLPQMLRQQAQRPPQTQCKFMADATSIHGERILPPLSAWLQLPIE